VDPAARQPSSADPNRRAARRTSPVGTSPLQMDASDHRTVTTPESGDEKIRSHRHGGSDSNHGQGNGNG
jgi:hypothetical protein